MEDGPRLVLLLMAGVLPLMAMRDRLSRRMFNVLAALYAAAAVIAVIAFFTVGPAQPRPPADLPLVRT